MKVTILTMMLAMEVKVVQDLLTVALLVLAPVALEAIL